MSSSVRGGRERERGEEREGERGRDHERGEEREGERMRTGGARVGRGKERG